MIQIMFTCAACDLTVPARNVCVGPKGEQVCRACSGDGENDLNVRIRCTVCPQRGTVGSIWWGRVCDDPPKCACGAGVEEDHSAPCESCGAPSTGRSLDDVPLCGGCGAALEAEG